ncbi:hypothetical protein ACFLQ7_02400 [Actinomycetota bacterium]
MLEVNEGPLVYVPMGNSLMFLPTGSSVIDQYGAMLAEDFGVEIDTRDRTVGGQRTDAFLFALQNNDVLKGDLTEADVVTFVIPFDEWAEPAETISGADGRDPADCGGDDGQECLRDMVTNYNMLVDQIFAELVTIVDPTEQVILVQDFYQLHTERQGPATEILHPYFEQAQIHTREVAAEHGIPIALVWDDFMGTDGEIPNLTEAGLVQADGLHATAEGAERIANLYHDLGYELSS